MMIRIRSRLAALVLAFSCPAIAASSIDNLLEQCPSPGDVSALQARFALTFQADLSAG